MTNINETTMETTMTDTNETNMEETLTESVETTVTESVENTDETTMETTVTESVENTDETTMETKVDRRKDNPGRKPQFSDKWGIVSALTSINEYNGRYHYDNDGAKVSRVLTLQLVELGYLETFKEKVTQGRGRAKMFYRLTGKGKSYLALAARWKKPVATVETPVETMVEESSDLVPAE